MTVYDYLCSLWRTVVPALVGLVATALAHVYVDIDEQGLTMFLVTAFTTVYYGLFRLLEARVSPQFGWLLGLARPPAYTPPPHPGPGNVTR